MPRSACYLLLMILLVTATGCQAMNGFAGGFGQDMRGITDPTKNGWYALQHADAWVKKNLW